MSAHDGQPRKRGGGVVDKATPGQVMALARRACQVICVWGVFYK